MKNRLIILMAILFLAKTSCIYTSALAKPLAAPAAPVSSAPCSVHLPEQGMPKLAFMPVGEEAKRIARGLVLGEPGVPSVASVSAESDEIKVPVGNMPQRWHDSAKLIDAIRAGLGLPGDTFPVHNKVSLISEEGGNCAAAMQYVFKRDAATATRGR